MQIPPKVSEGLSKSLHVGSGRAAHALATLRNMLFAGIVVAIPIVVTIWVINLAYNTIAGISRPFLTRVGIDFPGISFVITLLLLLLLGFMATNVLGRRVLEMTEQFLLRVPLVATIYGSVKQIIESIKRFGGGANFKRVVYVEYPVASHYMLGFVTGRHYSKEDGRDVTTVFLPTAPNPMTGFVLIVDTDKVLESNLTLEEATKMILTAGLVGPAHTKPNLSDTQ